LQLPNPSFLRTHAPDAAFQGAVPDPQLPTSVCSPSKPGFPQPLQLRRSPSQTYPR
jgi:hypothetical protein